MLLALALALLSQAPGDEPLDVVEPNRDRSSDVEIPPERVDEIEVAPLKNGKKKPPARKKPPPKKPPLPTGPVAIPIDVAVGPIALIPTGPLFADQVMHGGITLNIAAVIDQDLIRREAHRIPKQWRGAARGLEEVRYRPWQLALLPEVIVISPQILNTGMYGATWRPVGAGLSISNEPVRISLNGALAASVVFIHSSTLGLTLFMRPGVNLEADVEIPITKTLLVSLGWSSDFFIPQRVGGFPWEFEPFEQTLWHLGGPYVKLHIRFPYEVDL